MSPVTICSSATTVTEIYGPWFREQEIKDKPESRPQADWAYSDYFDPAHFLDKREISLTSQIEELFSFFSFNQIIVPHHDEVRGYLKRYPDMIDLLEDVCKLAHEGFDSSVQLSLEVYHDPEFEDEYLTLYARQKEYGKEILNTIDTVSKKFEDKLADNSGWLILMTDFHPPK